MSIVEHPTTTGPAYLDADGNPARVVVCPDCGQMEWWTEEECRDHGKCRASNGPCWCEMEAPIGVTEAAQYAGVAYATMAQAVREKPQRVKARQRVKGGPWITSKQDVKNAIEAGHLHPRK